MNFGEHYFLKRQALFQSCFNSRHEIPLIYLSYSKEKHPCPKPSISSWFQTSSAVIELILQTMTVHFTNALTLEALTMPHVAQILSALVFTLLPLFNF